MEFSSNQLAKVHIPAMLFDFVSRDFNHELTAAFQTDNLGLEKSLIISQDFFYPKLFLASRAVARQFVQMRLGRMKFYLCQYDSPPLNAFS